VFPAGSPEWAVFPETCNQARKSHKNATER